MNNEAFSRKPFLEKYDRRGMGRFFWRRLKESSPIQFIGLPVVLVCIGLIPALIFDVIYAIITYPEHFGVLSQNGPEIRWEWPFLVFGAFFAIGFYVRGLFLLRNQLRLKKDFARYNKFHFINGAMTRNERKIHPASIFHRGSQFQKEIFWRKDLLFEFGNVNKLQSGVANIATAAATGLVGAAMTPAFFGFIRLRLKRRVPHLLLLSRKNREINNYIKFPLTAQKLDLEGDFHKHFDLYYPEGYERDVYYILTPDIMLLLVELSGKYSVELLDDQLYLWRKRFNLTKQKEYEEVYKIIETLGDKIRKQTKMYADDNTIIKSKTEVLLGYKSGSFGKSKTYEHKPTTEANNLIDNKGRRL